MTKKILFYEEKFPIRINLIETEEIYTNWHKELKILYFLKGNALVDLNKQKIKCQFYFGSQIPKVQVSIGWIVR